jgi:hypothetical protein
MKGTSMTTAAIRSGNTTTNPNAPAWADLTEASALDMVKITTPLLKGFDLPRFVDACMSHRGEFVITIGQGDPIFTVRDLNLNGDGGQENVNILYLPEGEKVSSPEYGRAADLTQFGQSVQYLSANGYTSADIHRMLNGHVLGNAPGEPVPA